MNPDPSMRVTATIHAEPNGLDDSPNYRVNFWEKCEPTQDAAWSLDAYVLSEARSYDEVLRWVKQNQRDRRVEIFVETTEEPLTPFQVPRVARLARLTGEDPNTGIEIGAWTLDPSPESASDGSNQR